jgi:hypothetical protein
MIAVASFFAMLSLVDRSGFTRAVKQHGAERGTKGLVAEINLWRCCSVRWEPHIRCARFAEV